MATGSFTQRKPGGGSYQRDPAGAYQRDPTPEGPPQVVEYPTVSLLGVPLAVRLKSARADVFVSREVTDLTFGSVIPGGFSSASISLHRPLSGDPPELDAYTTMYVYDGRSGATMWQGRLEDPGRASGNQGEIWRVNAVGPAAHARDITRPYIYVDQSLERWPPNSNQGGNAPSLRAEKGAADFTGAAGKLLDIAPRGVVVQIGWGVGHMYTALRETGQHIGRFSFTWDSGRTVTDWRVQGWTGAGAVTTKALDAAFNTAGGTGSAVITTFFSATHDTVFLFIARQTSIETIADDDTWGEFSLVKVRGTIYKVDGTEDTAGASYGLNTILASDVVKDLLGRLLSKFDGPNASVATTSYAISQLAYPDGVNAAQILDDLAVLEPGYFWTAFEDTFAGKAMFSYGAWPTTVGLEASAKDGFDSPGSMSEVFNAVSVRWRDVLGRIRRNRRTNPVQSLTDAGLTREAFIDLSDTMGDALNADRAGDQFLLEHATAPNAGTLTVQSPILSLTLGRTLQPWELPRHAIGQLIRVQDVKPRVDALNATARDAVTIFRVIGAEYNARDNSCRLALDSQARTLPRLLSPMTIPDYSTWGWNSTRRR